LLLVAFADCKSGLITTLTSEFFEEYKQDMMDVFEQTCQTLELPDTKLTQDIDLFMITMQLANQKLTEFVVNKEKSVIKIVHEALEGTHQTNAYILVSIQDMSMNFDLDFNILSRPEWFSDQGTGHVTITDFDASLHLIPFSKDGKLQFNFEDAILDVFDFKIKMNGNSELSEGLEMLINQYKSFFKNELVNILAR